MSPRRSATWRIGSACMLSILVATSGCENANRSMVFFTGTTLGVEIAFEPNSTAPAKFIVGYKRAEGLMDPIMDDRHDSTSADRRYTIRDTPHSVLAKIAGEINTGSGATSPGLQGAQWFASGEAAEILARHPATAAVLTNNPEVAKEAVRAMAFGRDMTGLDQSLARIALKDISAALAQLATSDDRARRHSEALARLVQEHLPLQDYPEFDWDDATSTLTQSIADVGAVDIASLLQYESVLRDSIPPLRRAIDKLDATTSITWDPAPQAPGAVNKGDAGHEKLKLILGRYESRYAAVRRAIESDPAVLDAVRYYFDRLIN